jgi:hypothetical protein
MPTYLGIDIYSALPIIMSIEMIATFTKQLLTVEEILFVVI